MFPDIQAADSAPLIHALNPVCSETIVDKHAHQQLKIECIAPNTLSDEGENSCIRKLSIILFRKYWNLYTRQICA